MTFQFDPRFALLPKFSIGLRPMRISEEDINLVASYLGIDLPAADMEVNARRLRDELVRQNGFLVKNLDLDSVSESDEYRRSQFIRDIVGNSRDSRARHLASKRQSSRA